MNRRLALLGGFISLVWGAASGWWPVALLLALGLELPLLLRRRLVLADRDFITVSKLLLLIMCLVFLGLLVNNPRNGLPDFITWAPVLFGVLVLLQVWSEQGAYPLRAVVCSLVRSPDYSGAVWPQAVDLRLFYFLLVLVSVSMNLPEQGNWFPLFAVLIVWLVWRNSPQQPRPWLWLAMAATGVLLSLLMVSGIDTMHRSIQQHGVQWMSEYWARLNARQTHTAIGNIGQLKLSGRILFRVEAPPGRSMLLTRATFSNYSEGSWTVDDHRFRTIPYDSVTGLWHLQDTTPGPDETMTVSAPLRRGAGMLVLPGGAHSLEIRGEAQVESNSYGAARVQYDDERIDYRIVYRNGLDGSGSPGPLDRLIPEELNEVITQTAQQLQLADLPPEQVPARLQEFFQKNFRYSLEQRAPEQGQSFIESFLRERREGHCEYFATTSTLLLRAAGIPSRYVVGYSMNEYSDTLDRYLVRERHGHAWTQAWINGAWHTLDYTPAGWQTLDAGHERWWRGIHDFFGNTRYLLAQWWQQDDKGLAFNLSAALLSLVLLGWLLRRMKGGGVTVRWNRRASAAGDSEAKDELQFHELLRQLEQRFGKRPVTQPIRPWVSMLPLSGEQRQAHEELRRLTEDYCRYRYGDETGEQQVETLRRRIQLWRQGPGAEVFRVPADPPV